MEKNHFKLREELLLKLREAVNTEEEFRWVEEELALLRSQREVSDGSN